MNNGKVCRRIMYIHIHENKTLDINLVAAKLDKPKFLVEWIKLDIYTFALNRIYLGNQT